MSAPALTPEQVLQDESIPLQKVLPFAAGQMREFSLKIAQPVYWRKSGSGRPLPLLVIKPVGYRLRNGSKLLDRDPAFLIHADLTPAIETLLPAYMDCWQIECSYRDEKSFGQVRNPLALAQMARQDYSSFGARYFEPAAPANVQPPATADAGQSK